MVYGQLVSPKPFGHFNEILHGYAYWLFKNSTS